MQSISIAVSITLKDERPPLRSARTVDDDGQTPDDGAVPVTVDVQPPPRAASQRRRDAELPRHSP